MSNQILLKRTTVQGRVPDPVLLSLSAGEIMANLTDKLIYVMGESTVFPIGKYSRLKNVGTKNVSYSAAPFELVPIDTTGGVVTVRLPENPPEGCKVAVYDIVSQLGNNPARVFATSYPVSGGQGGLVLQTTGVYVEFSFINSTVGWAITCQVNPANLPGVTLVDETLWGAFDTSTWSSSQAVLGTETLEWGQV